MGQSSKRSGNGGEPRGRGKGKKPDYTEQRIQNTPRQAANVDGASNDAATMSYNCSNVCKGCLIDLLGCFVEALAFYAYLPILCFFLVMSLDDFWPFRLWGELTKMGFAIYLVAWIWGRYLAQEFDVDPCCLAVKLVQKKIRLWKFLGCTVTSCLAASIVGFTIYYFDSHRTIFPSLRPLPQELLHQLHSSFSPSTSSSPSSPTSSILLPLASMWGYSPSLSTDASSLWHSTPLMLVALECFLAEFFLTLVHCMGMAVALLYGRSVRGLSELCLFITVSVILLGSNVSATTGGPMLNPAYSIMVACYRGDVYMAVVLGSANLLGAVLAGMIVQPRNKAENSIEHTDKERPRYIEAKRSHSFLGRSGSMQECLWGELSYGASSASSMLVKVMRGIMGTRGCHEIKSQAQEKKRS